MTNLPEQNENQVCWSAEKLEDKQSGAILTQFTSWLKNWFSLDELFWVFLVVLTNIFSKIDS